MSQYLGDISAYALAVSQGYTGTEEEYAELMASYATVGQTAVTAAQTATTKASEAATSATTATNKASEATTAATTATNKAAEAQADADAAALDASQALSAASTATTKATEATTAAATATSAKTDAVAANTAAQSAKTAAQTAQTGAETAAASVSASAAQITTNTEDIAQLKSDLNERLDAINDGSLILTPVAVLNDVIYRTDGIVTALSGCICYVYEIEQLSYHVAVTNRDNVPFGLSDTLYSGTQFTASVIVSESNVTEYDFTNNQNYKYLYITKKGQTTEYGVSISTNLANKLIGEQLNVIDVASDHLDILADNTSSYSRGYIISTTGAFYEWLSDNFYSTDYLDVEDVSKLILLMPVLTSSTTHAGAAFYDSEKVYISGIECSVSSVSGNETRVIDVPSNAKYIRTTCRGSAWSDFFVKHDDIYINALNIKKIKDKASTFGVQMFAKIGVIGDSISCGWAKDKNGNNSRRNTGISWPQQMARRLGCTAYNLGASGVDPVEWFQSNYEFAEYCYTQYQSVGFCDLYIIGLGLNPTSSIGTIADINQSDYTQNAETFYGQYARIIQMINAEHPDAIVICVTEPTTRIASTDQAVRDICALSYINANLLDLEKDYFDLFNTDEIISERQPDGLHYTPYGYSLLADAMETALNDYIAKHTTSFKYVGVASV